MRKMRSFWYMLLGVFAVRVDSILSIKTVITARQKMFAVRLNSVGF
jgi:hypothetical protein